MSNIKLSLVIGGGLVVLFFTNMDFLNPPGAWPDKEAIRVKPEPLPMIESVVTRHPADAGNVLYSCSCAQADESECSKGYVFNTMKDAASYSKQKCGDSCEITCFAKYEGEDSGQPVTASAASAVDPISQ